MESFKHYIILSSLSEKSKRKFTLGNINALLNVDFPIVTLSHSGRSCFSISFSLNCWWKSSTAFFLWPFVVPLTWIRHYKLMMIAIDGMDAIDGGYCFLHTHTSAIHLHTHANAHTEGKQTISLKYIWWHSIKTGMASSVCSFAESNKWFRQEFPICRLFNDSVFVWKLRFFPVYFFCLLFLFYVFSSVVIADSLLKWLLLMTCNRNSIWFAESGRAAQGFGLLRRSDRHRVKRHWVWLARLTKAIGGK